MADLDERIAWKLAREKVIDFRKLNVWLRQRAGVLVTSMRHDYPKETGRGDYCQSTLFSWVHEVNAEIEREKLLHRRAHAGLGRGHTVASGKRARRAGDPTQGHRIPIDQSSWDEETLKKHGKLDRWSRKRERTGDKRQ